MDVSTEPPRPGETTVRVTRYQGKCGSCDFEGLVIEGHDPDVMTGLACPDCVMAGRASRFAPEHPAMRPIVFVARAMRGEEPFRTLLESAEKQRENPEAHAAAVRRTQDAIARQKGIVEAQSSLGSRKGKRAYEAMERRAARKARRAAKRAKLRGGD